MLIGKNATDHHKLNVQPQENANIWMLVSLYFFVFFEPSW